MRSSLRLLPVLFVPLALTVSPGRVGAQAAPEGVTIEREVPYLTPDRKERLDLYLPSSRAKEARSPAVVIIHGGGWTGGSKSASREFNIGTTLAKAGYVCASIDYRLEAQDRWPTNVHDCKNAVRFLRKNAARLQVDPENIGVIGGSAGGHLALMVGYTAGVPELEPSAPYPGISSAVRAVVDMYGVGDVRAIERADAEGNPTGEMRQGTALFGDKAQITEKDLALGSPVTHLSKKSPPTLILHGTKDPTVCRTASIELEKHLKSAGVEHQLILIEGAGHTFDLQTWARKPLPMDLRPVVTAFFDRHLKR
jgi:acetyl esterase/lipase